MSKLFRALAVLITFLLTLPPSAFILQPSASLPPTATPGPTEVVATATLGPTFVLPTVKPPRPSHTPTATRTRTPTRTATATRTPTPTPAPIYHLQPGDNWIEAEFPTSDDIGTWALKSDPTASGGRALIATTANAGSLEYRFQLDYTGTIAVWLRAIRAPDTTRPIRIRLDTRGDDPASIKSVAWAWSLDDDAEYDVTPGVHTFSISGEASGVHIDRILITTDLDRKP